MLCSLFISSMLIQCYVMFNKLLLNWYSFKVAPQSIRCKWNLSKYVHTGIIFYSLIVDLNGKLFLLGKATEKQINKCCKHICTVLNLKLLTYRFLGEFNHGKYLTNRCLFAKQSDSILKLLWLFLVLKIMFFFSSSVIKPSD